MTRKQHARDVLETVGLKLTDPITQSIGMKIALEELRTEKSLISKLLKFSPSPVSEFMTARLRGPNPHSKEQEHWLLGIHCRGLDRVYDDNQPYFEIPMGSSTLDEIDYGRK
jgi:hypothetical protein